VNKLAPEMSIGEIADIIGGGTPSKSNPSYYNGTIPWATVRDMSTDVLSVTEHSITEAGLNGSSSNLIPGGEVIIATRVGLGKACILKQPTAINQDLRGVIPKPGVNLDRKYLHYWFKSISNTIVAAGTGATVQGVKLPFIKSLRIPLPPLDEQKRIVSILDQAFEGLDRARANAEANLESARELFEQAVEDGLSSKGDNWISTTINAVCDSVEYGTSSKSEPEGAVPVIRMGNMQDGEIDWTDLVYSNSPLDIAKYKLKPNDVLFNRTNSLEHVGKTAIYRGETTALFAGYLIRLNYKADIVNPEYLNFFLNSSNVRQYGRMVSGKSVNQANISGSKLKLYKISLPPLQEQMEIAGRLKDLKRQSNLLRHTYRLKLENVEGLRQSLLQKAFSGELT